MPDHLLLLWDVDHTLIETRGVGGVVFGEAFEKATGRPMSAGMAKAHGHTEPVLLEQTLDLNRVHDRDEDLFRRFADAQADSYLAHLDELRERGRALPGVEVALRELSRVPGTIQTVLTGNTRKAAQIKISAFGLDQYLDLEIGAYGDDDSDRPALVGIARKRAERRRGAAFNQANTVLIGDTPKDIEAAHTAGARVIAVASGGSTPEELTEAGADLTLKTLEGADSPGILASLLSDDAWSRRP
ncbi:phosphoglycolate phosphatase-like HAD superfamily hydrolase [Spinactinospora alkalitolerans]|uniref:Phosphoglycolate phosphatase-like HAD superfamily hydrolase n=1 Tax=Spinactinospora alkalitolerans TaxID=687207 RepID=A0A852U376_9ACTN|nr:HAD hydrolase-like protein [Spinactinospora alkalitolerans]NYE50047.1 phosphoglycolate phosphatase-like HAD superfamily hydrolase [Spinactinospora alkalitolerans]